ncbi:MAG: hypothetical protein ACRYHQ_31305 [Janthinobacterium lividum]
MKRRSSPGVECRTEDTIAAKSISVTGLEPGIMHRCRVVCATTPSTARRYGSDSSTSTSACRMSNEKAELTAPESTGSP